jgi:hypothetical protein
MQLAGTLMHLRLSSRYPPGDGQERGRFGLQREVTGMNPDAQRPWVYRRWPYAASPWAHLGLLLAGLAWWTAAVLQNGTWETSADANIGAGLALILVAGLGLPWSALLFMDPEYFGLPEVGVVLILTACALLNVTIHASFMARRHKRRTSDGAASLHA